MSKWFDLKARHECLWHNCGLCSCCRGSRGLSEAEWVEMWAISRWLDEIRRDGQAASSPLEKTIQHYQGDEECLKMLPMEEQIDPPLYAWPWRDGITTIDSGMVTMP